MQASSQHHWKSNASTPTCHVTVCSATATTIILSVLLIAFKAHGLTIYNDASGGSIPIGEPGTEVSLFWYPLYLKYTDLVNWTLATGGVSLILGASLGLHYLYVCRRSKPILLSTTQRVSLFATIGVNCVFCLVVFMVLLVRRLQSGRLPPENSNFWSSYEPYQGYGNWGKYDAAIFDLGSWACQLDTWKTFNGGNVMATHCVDETGALCSAGLLALSNMVLASIWVADWRGKRCLIRDHRDAFPDEYECEYL